MFGYGFIININQKQNKSQPMKTCFTIGLLVAAVSAISLKNDNDVVTIPESEIVL